jgi:hypothetical protein
LRWVFRKQTLCLVDSLATVERGGISADPGSQLGSAGKYVAADQDPHLWIARLVSHHADRLR